MAAGGGTHTARYRCLLLYPPRFATSFSASYLTYLRSPYYGIGYGANDVVLIVLWAIASAEDLAYLPMMACFVMFLVNDIYGFINWRRMRRRQQEHTH